MSSPQSPGLVSPLLPPPPPPPPVSPTSSSSSASASSSFYSPASAPEHTPAPTPLPLNLQPSTHLSPNSFDLDIVLEPEAFLQLHQLLNPAPTTTSSSSFSSSSAPAASTPVSNTMPPPAPPCALPELFVGGCVRVGVGEGEVVLCEDAHEVLNEPNSGGSSSLSEALSFEVLCRLFHLRLLATEANVAYSSRSSPKIDYVCVTTTSSSSSSAVVEEDVKEEEELEDDEDEDEDEEEEEGEGEGEQEHGEEEEIAKEWQGQETGDEKNEDVEGKNQEQSVAPFSSSFTSTWTASSSSPACSASTWSSTSTSSSLSPSSSSASSSSAPPTTTTTTTNAPTTSSAVRVIGVSVTRAMGYERKAFSEAEAQRLLVKKLRGLHSARRAASQGAHRWQTSLLHVWTNEAHVADLLHLAYLTLPAHLAHLRRGAVVLVTFARNAHWLFNCLNPLQRRTYRPPHRLRRTPTSSSSTSTSMNTSSSSSVHIGSESS